MRKSNWEPISLRWNKSPFPILSRPVPFSSLQFFGQEKRRKMSGSFLRNGGRRAYQFLFDRRSISPLSYPHHRSYVRSNLLSSKFRDSSSTTSHITPPIVLPSSSRSSVSSSVTRNGFVGWYLGMIEARPVLTKSLTACAIFTAADISSQVQNWPFCYKK